MIRAALVALMATPAAALTCAPPHPILAFQAAQASPESYVVLLGRLDFDASRMPESGYVHGQLAEVQAPAPVAAAFSGQALGPTGFAPSSVAAVTLNPTCAGPWCGRIEPGEWLLFARETAGGWQVEIGPCGGQAFERPDRATEAALVSCMAGGACAP